MKKYVKVKIFCGIAMPSEKDNKMELNQYMKSDKMSYIIDTDIETLIKKVNEYAKKSRKFFNKKNR